MSDTTTFKNNITWWHDMNGSFADDWAYGISIYCEHCSVNAGAVWAVCGRAGLISGEAMVWAEIRRAKESKSDSQSSHVIFTWLEFLLHIALIEIAFQN